MLNWFFRKKEEEKDTKGDFVSLLKVIHFTSQMVAIPGKLNPNKRSDKRREYEVFLEDISGYWTVAAGRILNDEFFPLDDQQRFLVGNGVSEIASIEANRIFLMKTTRGFMKLLVNDEGKIINIE